MQNEINNILMWKIFSFTYLWKNKVERTIIHGFKNYKNKKKASSMI